MPHLAHSSNPIWRDAWFVLGLSVALFIALEFADRAQAALRRSWRESRVAPDLRGLPGGLLHPYSDSVWAQEFAAERQSNALQGRWEPYVYFRAKPYHGRFVTIDSSGLRVTPQAHRPGGVPLQVFFFGGSTTWGSSNRDSTTRPALVARRLAAQGFDPEVVNFAQAGWVSMQGLVTLIQELRAGNVPDAVVFWDGENEVPSAWRNGRPGVSYLESEREEDYKLATERRRAGGAVGARLAVRSLLMHSHLLARALRFLDRPAQRTVPPDSLLFCRAVVSDWLQEARLIQRLGAVYGFVPIMVWQPQWYTSGRPRSQFEREVAAVPAEGEMGEVELGPHRRECARLIDSLVSAGAGPPIVDLSSLHAADTGTVFLDIYGHTTERATAIEADTLTALLIARIPHATHAP